MSRFINRQIVKLHKKEDKMLKKKTSGFLQKNVDNISDKLEAKIPQNLRDTLENAFEKAFKVVFEKGTAIIEKTYSKDRVSFEYEINDFAIDRNRRSIPLKKHMKNIDKISKRSRFMGKGLAFAEGAGLGLLGIGLPDIPVFISVILKGIYETATGYGFEYDTPQERMYILKLIQAAVCEDEEKYIKNYELDQWAEAIRKKHWNGDLETEIKKTAKILSDNMLFAKFIQGLPVIGVAGSLFNLSTYSRVSEYAALKYKKRYLEKKKRKKILAGDNSR